MGAIEQLVFLAKKWGQGEGYLRSFSCDRKDLLGELAGKTVSIVGNARSLQAKPHGSAIDQADIVIRMHAAPLPSKDSHGSKTDWLALAMPVAEELIVARAPERVLWMAKKRKRVRRRFVLRKGFYLHPVAEWDRMRDELQAPPTTGVMLIDLAARSQAKQINLFGFDFFASLSLSGRRRADQVPHDFTAEKNFVVNLTDTDRRIKLHR
ncbi:MAG: hypothetical protein GY947_14915 [Rhodobacteraceae bacterium]|nr:hypothetical protein [Paracoccaceae bacterium]